MPGGLAVKLGYCDAGLRLKLPPPQVEINDGCGAGLNLNEHLTGAVKILRWLAMPA